MRLEFKMFGREFKVVLLNDSKRDGKCWGLEMKDKYGDYRLLFGDTACEHFYSEGPAHMVDVFKEMLIDDVREAAFGKMPIPLPFMHDYIIIKEVEDGYEIVDEDKYRRKSCMDLQVLKNIIVAFGWQEHTDLDRLYFEQQFNDCIDLSDEFNNGYRLFSFSNKGERFFIAVPAFEIDFDPEKVTSLFQYRLFKKNKKSNK